MLFQVPHVKLIGLGVDSGGTSVSVWCDGSLLIRVPSISEFEDLADEDSLGVGGIGTWFINITCQSFS